MYYYAFTIRCMNFTTCPTSSDFSAMISEYKRKYSHTDVRYHMEIVEKLNGNHNVHIHGMITSPKKVVKRMLESVLKEGYQVTDHDFVRSKVAWLTYIGKHNQQDVESQLLALHQTAGMGPALVGDDEDSPLELEEHKQFMKSLKQVNIFDESERQRAERERIYNYNLNWLKTSLVKKGWGQR